ncbi:hypothetical protein F5X98DRAFT_372109 [Xylaria grammica]|nr:hypothetical protein F5X98DRAFT_372109 [Xylaria grammica]
MAADRPVIELDSIARTSHLERLPPELLRAILSRLRGLTALRCATLSCRLILNSFTGSSSAIATRVFLNELDSCDVRPEAIAALLASRLAKPTRSSAHEFYKAHLQKRNVEVGVRLTLNEIAALSRLHSAASKLAGDFAEARLQELVATMKDGRASQPRSQPLELSALERRRIIRTLYIVEIFFNIFRQTSMPDVELGQCINDFLLNLAHWEIEQMACVQDFLFFQVSPSFNEMAAHVYTGESSKLNLLESIAKAKTYDRQHQLLDYGRIPRARSRTLYRALKDFSYEACDEQAPVSNYENSRDYAMEVKHLYFEDPDNGPFGIWKWADESASLRRSVYQRGQAKLRKRGYVMWDRARLDTLPIFRGKWQPPVFSPFGRSLPDDAVGEVDEGWASSWRERSRIYNEQGRGWWDFCDESKIVWTRGEDGPGKTHDTTTSLDEAKRAILALERP